MRAILEFCDFEPTLRLIEKYYLKARLKSCISDVSKGIADFEKEFGAKEILQHSSVASPARACPPGSFEFHVVDYSYRNVLTFSSI
ncbi:MAG TPA: hypothetical protein ENF45_06420 [Bacteroidetes bacterium]|nr:hypothetical protein [Bacteroidota bacterium]